MREQISVVHLDDDVFETKRVADALAKPGIGDLTFDVRSFNAPESLFQHLATGAQPDVVLLDVHMGVIYGLDVGIKVKRLLPTAVLVFYSQDIKNLYRAIEQGADDFVVKGDDMRELPLRLASAFRLARRRVDRQVAAKASGAVGRTLRAVAARIPDIVASAVRSVHISGESGTGKEVAVGLIAEQLGEGIPFIKVNCGAISRELVESTLFGHIKGSFTGAAADKKGLIEEASGGWIFLDEIASLSRSAQVALLRAIDNQEILRIGATKVLSINVRFASACHESLPDLVEAGTFRNDLWQRLKEVHLHLPPLRERLDEADDLLDHFCRTETAGPYTLTSEARHILRSYDWAEGNARELRNCIRVMTEKQVNKILTPLSIPSAILRKAQPSPAAPPPTEATAALTVPVDLAAFPRFAQLEEKLLVAAVLFIAQTFGLTLSKTADLLGMPKSTLSRRLRQARDEGQMDGSDFDRLFPAAKGLNK